MAVLCTLDKYKSFSSALNPLHNLELHFKPDCIDVHMLNSSNDMWINVIYRTPISTPCSFISDREPLQKPNDDKVIMSVDGNKLTMKVGKLTYSSPRLVDTGITRKNKDDIEIKWPHLTIPLTASDVADLSKLIKNDAKYDFIISNNTLSIINVVDDSIRFDSPCEVEGEHTSRFHGVNLIDCILSVKHFDGCTIILGTKCPIFIKYHCEWLDVNYMIAPIIENDS